MGLRHYTGSLPEKPTEWTCPSCGEVNTVPLKAGCQACRAGADARKAGEALPPVTAATAVSAPVRLPSVAGAAAARDWMRATDCPLDQVTPWANSEHIQEAFMAGVAWAQAQASAPAPVTSPVTPETHTVEQVPSVILVMQSTLDGFQAFHPLDAPTAQTILAALAFYRDNQLAYGGVPGQLTAVQVTDLIARLTPEETQP